MGQTISECMLLILVFILFKRSSGSDNPQVPCFFSFGDSLIDSGNNDDLTTLARADYVPYGIDFPDGTSGRFTNGRTVVDIITQLLGFTHFIPPYESARKNQVLRGVNYASAAAGIRAETGNAYGGHYSFTEQLDQFRDTVGLISMMFRWNGTRVRDHLSKCIYYVGMGSNDYLNNYFVPYFYTTSKRYDMKTYTALLLRDYTSKLQQLYDLGARKVMISGLGPMGCIPYMLEKTVVKGNKIGYRCDEKVNKAARMYNMGLLKMVDHFNKFPAAMFIYWNTYETTKDVLTSAKSYGFEVTNRGCCGMGKNNRQVTCLPRMPPCNDRKKYFYWDAFHPTEAANILGAESAYNSNSSSIVYPMNVMQLAMA